MNRKNLLSAMVLAVAGLASLPAAAQVAVTDAWARATTPGAKTAAGYLVFTNKGSEARSLLKIVSPAADRVSLHQTSVDANGVSRMWPLGKFEVQPGETLRFEPGARHLMFEGVTTPFVAGQKVALTLKFEDEPEFTVQLEVRPLVPDMPAEQKHDHNHK